MPAEDPPPHVPAGDDRFRGVHDDIVNVEILELYRIDTYISSRYRWFDPPGPTCFMTCFIQICILECFGDFLEVPGGRFFFFLLNRSA